MKDNQVVETIENLRRTTERLLNHAENLCDEGIIDFALHQLDLIQQIKKSLEDT